jgi:ABC-type branched-subunit amino acid transport system ATPase component
MSTPIVEARGLTKSFGKVQALAGLDLVAESGQVVAVLGPNGAGKTTFIRSVATLVRPDGGELRVAGIDAAARPEQVRRVIGLAGQYAAVEPAMTGRENVMMVARLYGQTRRQARANPPWSSISSASPMRPTARSAPTPGACGAGSTSAPAWSARPACCCSTSRPPASTPAAATSCGRPSAAWSPPAPTCC